MFKIGCHVSAAGGVWNAPKNAASLACETFQIFTRPPMGGKAPEITGQGVEKFKAEMEKYGFEEFVVHTPYFINFGSGQSRIYHGSIAVVRGELDRASRLGAKYVMTHLGSFKDLGREKGMAQTKHGLKEVLKGYGGGTEFLLEIAAGSGEVIGGKFEELAELMEDLVKIKGFGGVCFDTQHAFASGYDLRTPKSLVQVFKEFEKNIGLKWLKMSHVNDSKVELGSRRDRHDHIEGGKIGKSGFKSILDFLGKKVDAKSVFPLIWETEHDKVKTDIKILKSLRDKK